MVCTFASLLHIILLLTCSQGHLQARVQMEWYLILALTFTEHICHLFFSHWTGTGSFLLLSDINCSKHEQINGHFAVLESSSLLNGTLVCVFTYMYLGQGLCLTLCFVKHHVRLFCFVIKASCPFNGFSIQYSFAILFCSLPLRPRIKMALLREGELDGSPIKLRPLFRKIFLFWKILTNIFTLIVKHVLKYFPEVMILSTCANTFLNRFCSLLGQNAIKEKAGSALHRCLQYLVHNSKIK